jgi:hypothetical protein
VRDALKGEALVLARAEAAQTEATNSLEAPYRLFSCVVVHNVAEALVQLGGASDATELCRFTAASKAGGEGCGGFRYKCLNAMAADNLAVEWRKRHAAMQSKQVRRCGLLGGSVARLCREMMLGARNASKRRVTLTTRVPHALASSATQGFMSFELKDIGNGDFEVSQTYARPSAAVSRPVACHHRATLAILYL